MPKAEPYTSPAPICAIIEGIKTYACHFTFHSCCESKGSTGQNLLNVLTLIEYVAI